MRIDCIGPIAEIEFVRQRLAALLVVWLGLIWAASPALACARLAERDCCPAGSTSPCGDGSDTELGAFAAVCCVNSPAASPAVAVEARTSHAQPADSGSPDPLVTLAWFATLGAPRYELASRSPEIHLFRINAANTYLRTLRLRL